MMKKIILVITLFTVIAFTATAQSYEVLNEGGSRTYKGIINREIIEKDTSFKWYNENKTGYTPFAKAVSGLKRNADSVQLLVFMGTWCGDSHNIIPKFYTLLDSAGFAANRVTMVGVDRSKKTSGHLAEALNVLNVPTIIVMKNGKETGRVVEYGKYGLFDIELAEILDR